MDIIRKADSAAGWFVAGVFTVSTAASTYDSYTGLLNWALEHGDHGAKAAMFPLFIDAFALGAEAFLFRAANRGWGWGARIVGWIVAGAGLALSVALNVGQYHSTDWLTQGTQGIAPLAAFFSLLVGSIMFEKSMKETKKADEKAGVTPQDDTESVTADSAVDAAEEPQDEAQDDAVDPDLAELFKRAELVFTADIAKGKRPPGIGRIKKQLGGGQVKVRRVQAHLADVIKQQALAA